MVKMHKTGDFTRKLDTERGEAGNGNFLSAGYISSLIFFKFLGGMWAASVYFLVQRLARYIVYRKPFM